MNDDTLVKLLADYAVEQLRYDEMFPDVGMGMSHGHALDLAKNKVLVEAARWNSLAALQIQFTTAIEKAALEQIKRRIR